MASQQNLRDLTNLVPGSLGFLGQIDFMQASHAAAIDADEVRMLTAILVRRVSQFKSPDVIAQFGSNCESRIDQITEVTKHRGLVETQRNQVIGNLTVSCRAFGGLQPFHHRDPGCRGTKADSRENFTNSSDCFNVIFSRHDDPPQEPWYEPGIH